MCEPAALNEWLASGEAAVDFEEAQPAVQLASRTESITAHAGMLAAAKAVVNDILVRLCRQRHGHDLSEDNVFQQRCPYGFPSCWRVASDKLT